MTSPHEEIRFEIISDIELGETEEARQRDAVRLTHSLLGQWRTRFPDEEVIEPKPSKNRPVTLGSASPTEAVAEVTAENGSRLRYELSGEEGNLTLTECPKDGEPRVIEGDFVSQHDELARIIFDFDRELARRPGDDIA